MTEIPHVHTFVKLKRAANGVSRVKFAVVYDTERTEVQEGGLTLRKARERAASILARNPHARFECVE